MLMKELTMEYVTPCLMHEMLNCKEKEPECDDATMVSRQSKADDPPS